MKISKKALLSLQTVIVALIILVATVSVMYVILVQIQQPYTKAAEHTSNKVASSVGGTSVKVFDIYGEDGSDDEYFNYVYVKLKSNPGTVFFNVGSTILSLSLLNGSEEDYLFNETINCSETNVSDPSSITQFNNTNYFGMSYLLSTRGARSFGSLAPGDLALLCFALPYGLSNDQPMSFRILPLEGTMFLADMVSPETTNSKRVMLYHRD